VVAGGRRRPRVDLGLAENGRCRGGSASRERWDTRPIARFVLLHGAWHGGWCFGRVAAELEDRGHEVASPDLPCETVGLTPLDYAREVGPRPDAIVVGHSLGGFTIPHIEARLRVYLAALPPLERREIDECFVESFGGPVRDSSDRSYWPDADTAAARLYPDCSRPQSDWAFARLRRQARLEPVPAPFGPGDVVIATLRDAAVDPDWQIRTARVHGARVIELDSGHSPFITQPDELADVLDSLA
jgi:pimeloyl-ACP methyl ester carboxylesterase